jgi:hypothetical protein
VRKIEKSLLSACADGSEKRVLVYVGESAQLSRGKQGAVGKWVCLSELAVQCLGSEAANVSP